MNTSDVNHLTYLNGEKLIGDDFTPEQIEEWYKDETEAYADLGSNDRTNYNYDYDYVNQSYGFKYLDQNKKYRVLGFGSAYGDEFKPILHLIESLTIIEPSLQLRSTMIGNIAPKYISPNVDGTINFPNESFDLIVCYDAIHHVANVSYVFGEFHRVLAKEGIIMLREPIISMSDWSVPRPGMTKRERGIPHWFFKKLIQKHNLKIVHLAYYSCMNSLFQRKFGKLFKRGLFAYPIYVNIDKMLSKIFKFNTRYNATNMLQRISPQSVYYTLKK